MDNPITDQQNTEQAQPAQCRWSPAPVLVSLGWALAVAAVVGAILSGDPAGTLLLSVAAAALVLFAVHGTIVRPRLSADGDGLTVRGFLSERYFDWRRVDIQVRRTRRLGRVSSTLELTQGERIIILGTLDLGSSPESVAATLRVLHR